MQDVAREEGAGRSRGRISVYLKICLEKRRTGLAGGGISPEARSYAVDGRASDLLEGDLCPVLWETLYVTAKGSRLPQMSDLFLAHMG